MSPNRIKHIVLTGASGIIGSRALNYLHAKGYNVTAIDIRPLPGHVPQPLPNNSSFAIVDSSDASAVQALFATFTCPPDGLIHVGAISNPSIGNAQLVHNINVVSSYNLLSIAIEHGVKRLVQASSVNTTGLAFTPIAHRAFDELPLHPGSVCRPEDPYSLSKLICEIQAESLCRTYPNVRIASLRFHRTCDRSLANVHSHSSELWGWTSIAAAAESCLLGITAEEPTYQTGHQVFNVVHQDLILDESNLEATQFDSKLAAEAGGLDRIGALKLVETFYPGTRLRPGWWTTDSPRRGLFDTTSTRVKLGWEHRDEFEGGDADGLAG